MDKIFQEEERRIDLASIRKIDSNITHILDKTDNVAFYRFDGKAWHKQDIHGSIFVFSRSVAPYYGFTILNRKSLSDNLIELLVDGLEFQRCDLYLLYKTRTSTNAGDTGIKSIWFEDDAGCIRISTLLHRLLRLRNESPTEGSGNILQMFEKSKDRVRQSASPDISSPGTSPPYRHNKKRNNNSRSCHDEHDYRTNHYRNEHDYRTNNYKNGEEAGRGYRNSHGNNGHPHVKHQYNEKQTGNTTSNGCTGQKQQDKNLLNLFSQAHIRYAKSTSDSEQTTGRKSPPAAQPVSKSVTIMKRSNSEHPETRESSIVPGVAGLCKSRSTENITDLNKAKEPLKDVKSIPITFQDLVNSVQPRPDGRPLSCYSIEGSTSSSAEEIVMSSGEGGEESGNSPRSSNSDPSSSLPNPPAPAPLPAPAPAPPAPSPSLPDTSKLTQLTASLSMSDSAKLLMSPLDFQKFSSGAAPLSGKSTPTKRTLFGKSVKDEAPTTKVDMDLRQFKRLMISAIEEDDQFAGVLFNVFQKKLTRNR